MRIFAMDICQGVEKDAIVKHPGYGEIFAYEVDGFEGVELINDTNIPSLLAMPLWNFTNTAYSMLDPTKYRRPHNYFQIYRNARHSVLSEDNPYFMRCSVISAVGGPHVGPGKLWLMAAVIAALTVYEPASGVKDVSSEMEKQLEIVLDSTAGSGVVHESFNSWNEYSFTRP